MEYIYKLIQDENHNKSMATCKFIEEAQEFLEESYKADTDIDATLEEGFDVIQSVISYWDTIGITTKEIFEGLKKHNDKLENRSWDREAIWRVEMFGICSKKKLKEVEEQYKKEIEEKDARLQELKEFSDSKLKEMEDNYNKSLLEKDEVFHKLNKEYELNLDLADALNKEIGKLNKQLVREKDKTDEVLGKIEKEKAIFLRTKSGRIKKKYAKKILDKLD